MSPDPHRSFSARSSHFLGSLLAPKKHVPGNLEVTDGPSADGSSDIAKAKSQRQLAWKFFSNSGRAYQLNVLLRPIGPGGKEMGSHSLHQVQGSINGMPVVQASIEGKFRAQTADIVFQVPKLPRLSELHGCTFDLSVSEGPKGALTGTARIGKQLLWSPEYALGSGEELVRQLTWRLVHGSSSYYLTLTFSHKFGLVRLALNGFVVLEKQPSILTQLPIRKAKYEMTLKEPGLGDIIGCKLQVQAQLRGDVVDGTASVDGKALGAPVYYKGLAPHILPLLSCNSSSQHKDSMEGATPGWFSSSSPAPAGWRPPHNVLQPPTDAADRHARLGPLETSSADTSVPSTSPSDRPPLQLHQDRMDRQQSATGLARSTSTEAQRASADARRSSDGGAAPAGRQAPPGAAAAAQVAALRATSAANLVGKADADGITRRPSDGLKAELMRSMSLPKERFAGLPGLSREPSADAPAGAALPIFGDESDDDAPLEVPTPPRKPAHRVYERQQPAVPQSMPSTDDASQTTYSSSTGWHDAAGTLARENSLTLDHQGPFARHAKQEQSFEDPSEATNSSYSSSSRSAGLYPPANARQASLRSQASRAASQVLENVLSEQNATDPSWGLNRTDIDICRNERGKKIRIGEGGSGTVYKALMHGCDEVAIKLVRTYGSKPAELSQFHREVTMMRMLRHRHVVQFYGASLQPDYFFIVTELMSGGNLFTALRRSPALFAWHKMGLKVALDMALGLNYLHSRRPAMIHRDMKSPNILLTREGMAKIADVGMMHMQVNPTATAQSAWTPVWAAPEVFRQERISVQADIWSYGLIIWEIVSQENIANSPPLGLAVQVSTPLADHPAIQMPSSAPPVAARIFHECTKLEAHARPSALDIVRWLRNE